MCVVLFIKPILTWAAILCSLVSAFFWFKASTAVVTDPNNVHNPGVEAIYTDKRTGKDVFVVATAMEQSRLNKIAAILTGLTLLLQAGATACP
jgi:hypothetical protein